MDNAELGAVDRQTIDCWRTNYGLDKTTHELHAFWGAWAPAGAVLALKAAVCEIERLREFAQWLIDSYHSEDGMPSDKDVVREARSVLGPNSSDRRTTTGQPLPQRWPSADTAWNEQGRHAQHLRAAIEEADRIMGHDDAATEWRERWAHLWPNDRIQPTAVAGRLE